MSRTKIEAIACDRCGEGVQLSEAGEALHERAIRETWVRLYAANLRASDFVGKLDAPADLCAACAADLVRFMAGCSLAGAAERERAEA